MEEERKKQRQKERNNEMLAWVGIARPQAEPGHKFRVAVRGVLEDGKSLEREEAG